VTDVEALAPVIAWSRRVRRVGGSSRLPSPVSGCCAAASVSAVLSEVPWRQCWAPRPGRSSPRASMSPPVKPGGPEGPKRDTSSGSSPSPLSSSWPHRLSRPPWPWQPGIGTGCSPRSPLPSDPSCCGSTTAWASPATARWGGPSSSDPWFSPSFSAAPRSLALPVSARAHSSSPPPPPAPTT
jgi:hypothetical protein